MNSPARFRSEQRERGQVPGKVEPAIESRFSGTADAKVARYRMFSV